MLKSTMKTEIRVGPNGYEVWYSTDGKFKFHKSFKSIEDATKETVSMKGHRRLLSDLIRKFRG